MKKITLLALLAFAFCIVNAQEFPTAWKSKFSFKPDKWNYPADGKYVSGRDESQAEMLDGNSGKPIWKINFKEDFQVKGMPRAVYNYEAGIILYFKDDKKQNGEKVIVDYLTGKELWRTMEYPGMDLDYSYHFAECLGSLTTKGTFMVFDNTLKKFVGLDARSGVKKWESSDYPNTDVKNVLISKIENSDFAQVFIDAEKGSTSKTEYVNILTGEKIDESAFVEVGGNYTKGSPAKIVISQTIGKTNVKLTVTMNKMRTKTKFKLETSGDLKWSKEFDGTMVLEVFTEHPYVKLDVQGDKIFVLSKSISVFDLKTGSQLWEAPFDNCDMSVGMRLKQEFGIAGWPLVVGDYVYYVDLKIDNAIKKVEAKTGKLVWKSEKIKSNDRIPNLVAIGGVLVAQFGGMINTQIYIPNTNGGSTTKTENRFDGNFGLKAYDTNTGNMIWTSEKIAAKLGDKFSDRITSIYGMGNKVIVASNKNLFCLDAKTGEITYKTEISPSKIGDAVELLLSEDAKTLYLYCDNGVASMETATGKLNYATKTDDIFWKYPGSASYTLDKGDNFFIWVGEKDFIGFDLPTGTIKGKMKDNLNPEFTDDGNYVFVRDGANISKYSMNK